MRSSSTTGSRATMGRGYARRDGVVPGPAEQVVRAAGGLARASVRCPPPHPTSIRLLHGVEATLALPELPWLRLFRSSRQPPWPGRPGGHRARRPTSHPSTSRAEQRRRQADEGQRRAVDDQVCPTRWRLDHQGKGTGLMHGSCHCLRRSGRGTVTQPRFAVEAELRVDGAGLERSSCTALVAGRPGPASRRRQPPRRGRRAAAPVVAAASRRAAMNGSKPFRASPVTGRAAAMPKPRSGPMRTNSASGASAPPYAPPGTRSASSTTSSSSGPRHHRPSCGPAEADPFRRSSSSAASSATAASVSAPPEVQRTPGRDASEVSPRRGSTSVTRRASGSAEAATRDPVQQLGPATRPGRRAPADDRVRRIAGSPGPRPAPPAHRPGGHVTTAGSGSSRRAGGPGIGVRRRTREIGLGEKTIGGDQPARRCAHQQRSRLPRESRLCRIGQAAVPTWC